MSLYVHPENQRVLWNTINKAANFVNIPDSDQWFKQVIAHFYHHNMHRNLSQTELLKLNKDTIEYMIQQLKAPTASVPVPAPTASVPALTLDPDTKMSIEEMNDRLNYRHLQDQIDELREEIRTLRKPT